MKNTINFTTILFMILTPVLSQQLFVEPEIGLYKPSEEDYDFSYSPRFGGNVGLILKNDIQVYAGYKLWSEKTSVTYIDFGSIDANTKFNTLIIGARKYLPQKDSKIGFRLGAEYIMSNVYEEDDFVHLNSLWELEGKGSGFSFEGGVVYIVNEKTQVFAGLNYLKNDITIDKITIDGVSYSRQELGMSEDEATLNMDGINFKVSVTLTLSGE